MKFFHTLVFISLPKICTLPPRVCPFLLLSVLNNTSESLKIQMLQSLWNVGANFTVETFRTATRASWKAQAAHGAARDFQTSVLTSLSPILWRWSQNLTLRSNVVHAYRQLHFLLDSNNGRQRRKLRFNLCNRSLTPPASVQMRLEPDDKGELTTTQKEPHQTHQLHTPLPSLRLKLFLNHMFKFTGKGDTMQQFV